MSLEEFIKMYGTDGASLIIAQLIVLAESSAHEDSDLLLEARTMNQRLLQALRSVK